LKRRLAENSKGRYQLKRRKSNVWWRKTERISNDVEHKKRNVLWRWRESTTQAPVW
jgi:hypothetical protein